MAEDRWWIAEPEDGERQEDGCTIYQFAYPWEHEGRFKVYRDGQGEIYHIDADNHAYFDHPGQLIEYGNVCVAFGKFLDEQKRSPITNG